MPLTGPLDSGVATIVANCPATRNPSTFPNTYPTVDTTFGSTQASRPSIFDPLTIGTVTIDPGVLQ